MGDRVAGPALELAGISKSYGTTAALSDIDLAVDRGEILALIGANGAGKTTLLSIVAGLRRPDAGAVRVLGTDTLGRPGGIRALLGLAPQDIGVYPTVTVRENLLLFGELAGLRGRVLAERMDETAEALALAPLLARPVRELSGGQRRRVHVAVAVLHRPPMVLLDEPSTSLDREGRRALLDLVNRLATEGSGVLYSTNQLGEAEALAGSVAILDGGRLAARGPLAELVARYAGAAVESGLRAPAPSPLEGVFLALTGHRYERAGPIEGEAGRHAALP